MAERHLRQEEKEKKALIPKEEVKALLSEVEGKSKRETEKVWCAPLRLEGIF